jgi:hypothetical protein
VKDGASLRWDVASLVFDLANLPAASFAPAPASRGTDAAAELAPQHAAAEA